MIIFILKSYTISYAQDFEAAGNLTKPGNTESPTSSNESLDQAQHDPMESLEELKEARGGSDRSTLTMLRTWQPPIAITALLGVGTILLLWLAYFIGGHEPSFTLDLFIRLFSTLFAALFMVTLCLDYLEPIGEGSSLDSLLLLRHVIMAPWVIVPFVLIVALVCILAPPSFTFFLSTSTILGVCLLVLVLEMRRSVHLRLLWYNATGKSLRPCNMLKAQYYS